MSYTPTNWQSGDVVTAAKLNKIEQGIASSGEDNIFVIPITYDVETYTYTMGKTFNEIFTAASEGKMLWCYCIPWEGEVRSGIVVNIYEGEGPDLYAVGIALSETGVSYYTTDSASGYPSFFAD